MKLDGRPLPKLEAHHEPFWTGGAHGELLIMRCWECGYWIHPPAPVCARCLSRALGPEPVAGTGRVATFNPDNPTVAVVVQLDEQPGLRLTTRLVDCLESDVRVGLPVEVEFHQLDSLWIPRFHPRWRAG